MTATATQPAPAATATPAFTPTLAAALAPTPPGSGSPLWPKPIPVLGVTGPYAAGKTVFLLSIAPGPRTLIYDTEKSSESYVELGMRRIDVASEMLAIRPNGHKPADTFVWWMKTLSAIKPGQFDVIAVDVIEEIELGLAGWVWDNPTHFGKTRAQYLKMEGLYWGDVKVLQKQILATLASKCQTFAFSTHLGKVWANNAPTQKEKPKGKTTLMELASLYLRMDREKDAAGNYPPKPAATIIKSRLTFATFDANGDPTFISAIPPRLPIATPAEIRRYLSTPKRPEQYTDAERAPEATRSDDERADIRLETARAEESAERLRLERLHAEQQGKPQAIAEEVAQAEQEEAASQAATTTPTPEVSLGAAMSSTLQTMMQDMPPPAATTPQPDPAPASNPEPTPEPAADARTPHTPGAAPLPADDKTAALQLWEEFCHLRELTHDAKEAAWKSAVLTRFGAKDNRGIKKEHWQTLRQQLAPKVAELTAEREGRRNNDTF